jgi:predicted dithiol-disulfide oxidoreductase (DUF899 family)
MTERKVSTREEWETARNALLKREKELTRRGALMPMRGLRGWRTYSVNWGDANGACTLYLASAFRR